MDLNRFCINGVLRWPSWIWRPQKNNSALNINVLNIFLIKVLTWSIQWFISYHRRKNITDGQTDRRTDRWTDGRTGRKHICLQPIGRRHNKFKHCWMNYFTWCSQSVEPVSEVHFEPCIWHTSWFVHAPIQHHCGPLHQRGPAPDKKVGLFHKCKTPFIM